MKEPTDSGSSRTGDNQTVTLLAKQTRSLLDAKLTAFFSDLAEQLFTLSSVTTLPKSLRPKAFEAYAQMKAQQRALVEAYLRDIDDGFVNLINPDKPTRHSAIRHNATTDELDLIDLDEFNDDLAINRMAQTALGRHWRALEAITLRVAKAVSADPKHIELPIGPQKLAKLYRNNTKIFEFAPAILREIDQFFLKELLLTMGDIYKKSNELLTDRGLMPDIEKKIDLQGSQLADDVEKAKLETPQQPQPKGGSSRLNSDLIEDQQQAHAAPSKEQTEDHLGAATGPYLSDMLSPEPRTYDATETTHDQHGIPHRSQGLMTEHGNYLPGRSHAEGKRGIPASNPLSTLDGEVPGAEPDENLPQKAREIAKHILDLRKQGVTADRIVNSAVRQLDLDQLTPEFAPLTRSVQLVDNLYSTMDSHLALSEAHKNSMNTVRLPLAQLSISEPKFYRNPEHPARLFMERLSEVMALAPENNHQIAKTIDQITTNLNESFGEDTMAFSHALDQTTNLALQLLRKQQTAIDRLIAAEEGREKRFEAQRAVTKELEELFSGRLLTTHFIELVGSIAVDGLTILVLQNDADAYQRSLEQLLGCVKTLELGDESLPTLESASANLSTLRHELRLPEILPPEQETLFERVASAMTGQIPKDPFDIYAAPLTGMEEPTFSRRLKDLPRLQRWVQRAQDLAVGTWVTDKVKSNDKKHVQLIWKNETRTRFVFVTEKAQKYREFNVVTLARWLACRLNPVQPADQLSIVDRSLFNALEQKQLEIFQTELVKDTALDLDDFMDMTHMHIRKARRKGGTPQCGVAVASTADNHSAVLSLFSSLLANTNSIYAKLDEHHLGLIVPLDESALRAKLAPAKEAGQIAGLSVKAIDGADRDAAIFWQKLRSETESGSPLAPASGSTARTSAPEIQRSVVETLKRLQADMPPTLTFRAIEITIPNDKTDTRKKYQVLLDGTPSIEPDMGSLGSHHSTALAIALDCLKVNAVCDMVENLVSANLMVPCFHINLSISAANHHQFLDFLLSAISNSGIGTDRLCFELRDSLRLRESAASQDFSRALRSIGCLISIAEVHPSRGSTAQLQALHPHVLVLSQDIVGDSSKSTAEGDLQRAITELHHMIDEDVALRAEIAAAEAVNLGIDIVETIAQSTITPAELKALQPELLR